MVMLHIDDDAMRKIKLDITFDVVAGEKIEEVAQEIVDQYELIGYKIVTHSGPAGGWPVIEFEGKNGKIRKLMRDYGA